MSSDESYQAFLDKANKDYSGGSSDPVSASNFKALSAGEAPVSIKKLEESERCYMSDTDQPFESVTIKWEEEQGWPSAEQITKLLSTSASPSDISTLSPAEWDPQSQYKDVIDAVKEATGDDKAHIRIYQVPGKGSRVEYFVLGLDRQGKRLVGLKALAIES